MIDIEKQRKIIESFIFEFHQNKTVNEVINTVDEAIEIQKHLRGLLTKTLMNVEKIIKGEIYGEKKINEKKDGPKDF